MEDEILIVDNTIEEITIEEFNGAPTGTIISTTHTMSGEDQHTIGAITGLETRLSNIEALKPVRSDLSGHADYYLWGETENIGPGYFVRLDKDGMIHKCTNETIAIRPKDLPLETDENGKVIIYVSANNITTADITKYYIVGTKPLYDIYAYDGVDYVQKSAYSYDGKQVIKTCHTSDILGVTVSEAGFKGNDKNIIGTLTSERANDINYALVATTGVVDVLCNHDIVVGDYVFPTVSGWAAKSTGSYGYLVTALIQNGQIVQEYDNQELLYARIVLSRSMVNEKKVSDNIDYLLGETQRIAENVVKAVSDAQTALNQVQQDGGNLADRVTGVEGTLGDMAEQLYTNTVTVNDANKLAQESQQVANQAKSYVDEVTQGVVDDTNQALSDFKNAKDDVDALLEDMQVITEYKDPITGEVIGAAGFVSKQEENGAVLGTIQTWQEDANETMASTLSRVSATESSIMQLNSADTELRNTLTGIEQRADENGSSITALTSKIDKYVVGEYSQAYGLTQAEVADILEPDKYVFIPTDFMSSDKSFTEYYNPIVLTKWDATDKNPKYVYQVDNDYYYNEGDKWVKKTINDAQANGYCHTIFTEHYSYMWDGTKWAPETGATNVTFSDTPPTVMSSIKPYYWIVGGGLCINVTEYQWNNLDDTKKDITKEYYITDTKEYYYYNGTGWVKDSSTRYKIGGLYLAVHNDEKDVWEWKEVALGSSNSMSRVSALMMQTQNSWQAAITNVNKDMAAISARVDENGSNVAMVASVVKEVKDVNLDFVDNTEKTPYASKNDIISTDTTKYFVVKRKDEKDDPIDAPPYDIYYYNGTTHVQKINWSYDGTRVLEPNTASIVTSANEDTSGILLSASHIKFEGESYTVDAGNVNFTGDNYKIKANNIIEIEGSTTFGNYAKLEDVIKEQRVEYVISTSNTEPPADGWSADYPDRNEGEYIWRRIIIIKGNGDDSIGVPELITPSDGKDGTSVSIKGTASSVTDIGDGLYTITFKASGASTASTVVNGTLGDGYIYNGDLYVCVKVTSGADHFSNVGQIQGPQGASGASLQVRYKASDTIPTTPTGTNPTGWDTNMPTSGTIYMSQKLSNSTTWTTPIQITGKDGEPGKDGSDIEYVYYRCNSSTFNTKPSGNITATSPKDNTWTISPNGVTESQQYEYVSVRTKKAGATTFGAWSSPTIWSKWGEKGQDGDGVEYLYYLTDSNATAPKVTTKWGVTTIPSGWTDEPSGTTANKPYEYVVQIKSTDTTNKEFVGKLWGVYDGMLALYAKSTGMPSTPTGEGGTASSAESTTWQKEIPTGLTGAQVIYASYKTFLGKTWSAPVKIYAVDGKDGTSVSIKGTADSVALIEGEFNKFTLVYNGSVVAQGALGDGYIYEGDLYVCVDVLENADHFENVGEIKGDAGPYAVSIETYYCVTKNKDETPIGGTNPIEPEEPTGNSEWHTSIENWGKKLDANKNPTTNDSQVKYIYQYLWVREKYIMSDHTEEQPHIEWSDPRLDASNTTMGQWCYENDKTVINGGAIATGSITAKQLDADSVTAEKIEADAITAEKIDVNAIKSRNYKYRTEEIITKTYEEVGSSAMWEDESYMEAVMGGKNIEQIYRVNVGYDSNTGSFIYVYYIYDKVNEQWIELDESNIKEVDNGTITFSTGNIVTTGSFLNLTDGSFDSKNFKIGSDGNVAMAGTVSAKTGDIGGYIIGETDLTSGNVGMSSDTSKAAFWAGSTDSVDAPFNVTHNGLLTATNAEIEGVINATRGKIAGFAIDPIMFKITNNIKVSFNTNDWYVNSAMNLSYSFNYEIIDTESVPVQISYYYATNHSHNQSTTHGSFAVGLKEESDNLRKDNTVAALTCNIKHIFEDINVDNKDKENFEVYQSRKNNPIDKDTLMNYDYINSNLDKKGRISPGGASIEVTLSPGDAFAVVDSMDHNNFFVYLIPEYTKSIIVDNKYLSGNIYYGDKTSYDIHQDGIYFGSDGIGIGEGYYFNEDGKINAKEITLNGQDLETRLTELGFNSGMRFNIGISGISVTENTNNIHTLGKWVSVNLDIRSNDRAIPLTYNGATGSVKIGTIPSTLTPNETQQLLCIASVFVSSLGDDTNLMASLIVDTYGNITLQFTKPSVGDSYAILGIQCVGQVYSLDATKLPLS